MLDKKLQGCLLMLLFLLTKASGSLPEVIVDSPEAVAPASSNSSEGAGSGSGGKRRSLETGTGVFCVAMPGADPAALQTGLNWACGQGRADCTAIQPGGACFKQNNLTALASYAYNDYYHRNHASGATCSFGGTATTTNADPSSGQCIFAGSSMSGGGTPTANAPSALSPPTFTPFGNGSSFGSPPSGNLIPVDGAENLLSGGRRALAVLLLLALSLLFLLF